MENKMEHRVTPDDISLLLDELKAREMALLPKDISTSALLQKAHTMIRNLCLELYDLSRKVYTKGGSESL